MAGMLRFKTSRYFPCLASLLCVSLAAGNSLAADDSRSLDTALAAPVEQLQELDEVWVRGRHLTDLIVEAEDRFFALYNKLNRDRMFDVHCGHVRLSRHSMIMTRTCVPDFLASYAVYYRPATSGCLSDAYGATYNTSGGTCPAMGHEVVPVSVLAAHHRQAYAANVLKVIHSDPQLLGMAVDLARLYTEMELAQKRYVELKPVSRASTRRPTHPRAP